MWSNGSVFKGPSEPISIDPSPISHSNKPPLEQIAMTLTRIHATDACFPSGS